MPQTIELPTGQRLEFPDGMSQAEIADAIDAEFYPKPTYLSTDEPPDRNRRLRMEQAALREKDEGRFATKAFGVLENIVRPFANPIRATEELIEQTAIETGVADPGDKLLISPDREIGRAVNRMGDLSSGLVEDVAVTMRSFATGEPIEHGGNILAAAEGRPRPLQQAIADVGGYEQFAADISTTISHMAPAIIAQRGLVKGGLSESAAAGAAFGWTPEGYDPKTGLVMAAFPGVSKIGSDLAIKAVGDQIGSEAARNAIGALGAVVAAQVWLDASSSPDYLLMEPDEAKKLWLHNFGVNVAMALAGVPGLTKQGLAEIQASRQFKEALSESAFDIAVRGTLPSNAQRTVDAAKGVGPATEAAAQPEPRPAPSRQQQDRPWDVIDELESQLGGKMSLRAARELREDFKPFGALRRLFAPEGYAPDIAAQAASGFRKFETGEELLEGLIAAAEGRKAFRGGQSREQQQIKVEEKQRVEFEDKVLEGDRPGDEAVERVPVQDLFLGDRFKVMDRELEVSDLEFDADGRLVSLTVKDGPKFGVQTITPDMAEFIHVDRATFEPAKRPTEFVEPETTPQGDSSENAPKLRQMEEQGDIFSGQQEPFNLAGERGIDAERVAREREAAEQTRLEAEEIARQQQQQFALDPVTELDRPRPAFRLKDGRIVFAETADSHRALEREAETRGVNLDDIAEGGWLDRQGKFHVGDLERFVATKQAELQSRIERPRRSVFDLDDAELGRFFDRRFGTRGRGTSPLSAGRAGQFTFPTFEAFRDWMNARYAERDIEGMRLAFAEAGSAHKVSYIKENRAADPHLKAWITHLATGAPLPQDSPPIPRTTPRPMPGGGTMPATPPARPADPPPPPRRPTLHRKFDITALTQLFRQFGKFPQINDRLRRAYGRFLPEKQLVELKERLLWDTDLAERVLGHEIGHYIDLVIAEIGKGDYFAKRLKPLYDFRGRMWEARELRQEARNLSRDWRGNFPDGDSYRDTATELFADFMSAMFNNPEWVNQNYPKLYDAFQSLRDAKPEFKSAYREIETWLQGGTMARELRTQDRAAVERTTDALTEKKEKSRPSIKDRLTHDFVTLWQRAFEKEGKPRSIGTSITEKLETSYLWAAKRLALWQDDFQRTVQSQLNRVSDDPVQAHADLLSYSKAVRTIGERRAAGRWIEQNPDEARAILNRILELDDSIRAKFGSAVASAPDAGLYDLSAAVFREIHDRGEPFVRRMERAIDQLDLGVDGEAALLAFNVRGKLLNPGGLTPETAAKVIEDLRTTLTPEQFTALDTAAGNLRDLLHDVQKEMHDAGLISDKTWRELIEPNRDNYVPYAVLDYFDGKVRAGVMSQHGTAKDVADIAAATQLKVSSSYLWLQKQRQVQLLRDAYAAGGAPVEIGQPLKRANEIDRVRAQNATDDVSRAVIWQDGKPHLVEFKGDAGKLLQDALSLPEFYGHLEWLHGLSKGSHQLMQLYTQLSPRFLLYRNILRGFRTAGLKVGYGRALQQMSPTNLKRNLALARNYADAAFGGEMLPEVRALVESEALPPPRVARGSVRDLPNMRELLVRGSLPAFAVGRVDAPAKATAIGEATRRTLAVTDKVFTAYEAFEKIYNYQAAVARGLSTEQAAAVARRGGIPKPGVSGKWSSVMEILFPWTRVKTQGMRSTYEFMRDPEMRRGFAARFAVFEALPRLAKVALGIGLVSKGISWLMSDDENADDPVMSEVFKRVSPYKLALDDVIPTMLYDPRTGQYHYFWNYKRGSDIPKHFEVVSLRIPASEEGNVWGTMLHNALVSIPGVRKDLAKPGQGPVENMGNWALNQLGPELNPFIKSTATLRDMIVRGRNPEDPFRGQPSANPQLFDAGGTDRAQAIAGFVMNEAGGPGELAAVLAANAGLLDERALDALKQRLATDKRPWNEKMPFLGAVVSHDNYAQYRGERAAELEDKQLRAKARLVMTGEVRALYDFYYKNADRKDKLTESEREQFEVASDFVRNIWGTLTVQGEPNPDSFYSKAAHAVGDDGSKQAKETVKRDLDAAAAGHIANFLELNER